MPSSGLQSFVAAILVPLVLASVAWLLQAGDSGPVISSERENSRPEAADDSPIDAPKAPAVIPEKTVDLPPGTPDDFLAYVRRVAAELRKDDHKWRANLDVIREKLQEAMGLTFMANHPEMFACELEPRNLGELQRSGYRVEKVIFQTLPHIWMTSNVYVPEGKGPFPAVLCVHGHWRGAKQEPTVQARCIGLAKLGFLVLCVDAFGAGERGIGKALGEYHGEMVAATLWPTGLTLAGIQVYENRRALDYLATRGDVDMQNIGVTGASGGGNQTMYAGALDKRFKAVVPTCSVGNYQAYLGAACCMCEVVPGALQFTEEWGVLALVAPRALMVTSATQDSPQFSVAEAKKSIDAARGYLTHHNLPHTIKHTIIESKHDYNQPMREAMYGWMAQHLKGEGNGGPIEEPEIQTEEPETLRCFPGDSRPDDWVTLPQFAARVGREVVANQRTDGALRNHLEALRAVKTWKSWSNTPDELTRGRLRRMIVEESTEDGKPEADRDSVTIRFESDPGITLTSTIHGRLDSETPLALLLDLAGAEAAQASDAFTALRSNGWSVATLDLRATGKLAVPRDEVRRAPDHNSAEWSLWLGQPLLGQWRTDVRQFFVTLELLNFDTPRKVAIVGQGTAATLVTSVVPRYAAANRSAAIGGLVSYVSDVPYEQQRLGVMVPGILQSTGDIGELATWNATSGKLIIAGGAKGNGEKLSNAELKAVFQFTADVYQQLGKADQLTISADLDANQIVELLSR